MISITRLSARKVTLLAAASMLTPWLLSGCIVQPAPRVIYEPAPPPPQPAYTPPPPAYEPPPQPSADVALTAPEPPPPLPDYEQPPCPDEGYIWTPGYWHWSPAGYYWVPGTWVQPPAVGLLWTPGYWGFVGGVYGWHGGYWGPHVGYYGGVNYGFGYVGVGFVGGRWEGNRFAYNTAVNNVNTTVIHNTYNTTVVNNITVNKVSYNGGPGGVGVQPTAQERAYEHESHVPPTAVQTTHVQQASSNPALFAKANGGHPAIAATARPAVFSGPGVISAHGAAASTPIQNFNKPTTGMPNGPRPGQPGQGATRQSYTAHPPNYGGKPPTQVNPPVNNGYQGKPVNQTQGLQHYQAPTPPPKGNATGSGGKPPPPNKDKGDHEHDH